MRVLRSFGIPQNTSILTGQLMKQTIDVEENGTHIQYAIDENNLELFADGFGPAMVGYPFTKITLYREQMSAELGDIATNKKIVATITVPTATILQIAQTVKSAIMSNKEGMESAIDQSREIILS